MCWENEEYEDYVGNAKKYVVPDFCEEYYTTPDFNDEFHPDNSVWYDYNDFDEDEEVF